MPVSLIFGASGAVGRFLLPRLLDAGHDLVAISRTPRSSSDPRLRWVHGNLHTSMPALPSVDAIFSLGPLDAFAHWFAQTQGTGTPRVIAFGSMSIEAKRESVDPHERALVERLHAAENQLHEAAAQRGCAWTVFRPTLVYGAGVDRSLSPIARFALRWRVFPRIVGASGLRQPVHADDLAAACMLALRSPRTQAQTYALGGGERLSFDSMLERVRRSLPLATLPVPVPLLLARSLSAAEHALGRSARRAMIARLRSNLVADNSAATVDFDWSPRVFRPDASAWIAREG